MTCSVADCDKPLFCRAMCSMHYNRMQKHGSLEKPSRFRPPSPCAVEGCDQTRRWGGFCNRHYIRFRKHGDPLAYSDEIVERLIVASEDVA